MRRNFMKLLVAGSLALCGLQAIAQSELQNYVGQCKTALGFQDSDIPPTVDCYDGVLFEEHSPIRDFVVYKKVTDQVDLTMACRWLAGSKADRRTAVSLEMMLHNRQNGNTCVFQAKEPTQFAAPSLAVGPTSSGATAYWKTPTDINTGSTRCVGCHVSGPYISTPLIAPALAKYGLLNNGHDTLSNMRFADLGNSNPNLHAKYHFVGSQFATWDSERNTYIDTSDSSCSQGCHLIGTSSANPTGSFVIAPAGTVLANPFDYLHNRIEPAGVMPPFNDDSDYRWINLDTAGNGVDAESFADAKSASTTLVPGLLSGCAAPGNIEAHAVGIDVSNSFSTAGLAQTPDRLRSFNLKDGLVCLNADQTSGSCRDYDVRYLCSNGNWTPFYNKDTNTSDDGDHEERSKAIAQASAFCGSAPVGIHARVYMPAPGGGTIPVGFYGPNDRLARFSPYGLTCNNADQPDGQCSNYVVRYSNCGAAPSTRTAVHLTSVFTGRQLTATGTANNALTRGQPLTPAWNTQTWDIVPVPNTEYVRLRNTGTNTYLNVTTQAESATVVTYAFNDGFTSEEWIIEPVPNSNDARLKNLWSGRYLTIGDVPNRDFAPIYSQGLVAGWTSQRWVIN